MSQFINLHTHYLHDDKNISIYNNRFLFDAEIKTDHLFSIGIHPYDIDLVKENSFEELETFLNHKNCFAIGECGLDKLHNENLKKQIVVFEKQLQFAVKYKKPVIVHCVKAFDEVIEICKPFLYKTPIIIHGFNKSTVLAQQLISKGFYLSLNHHILTKPNFNLNELQINKIFFETDNDALISIDDIYKLASKKLNMTINELKEKIYLNFNLLFL